MEPRESSIGWRGFIAGYSRDYLGSEVWFGFKNRRLWFGVR